MDLKKPGPGAAASYGSGSLRSPIVNLLIGVGLTVSMMGCDRQDGPVERAGEAIDETIEDTRDSINDAGNAVDDRIDDAGDAIEDATDE